MQIDNVQHGQAVVASVQAQAQSELRLGIPRAGLSHNECVACGAKHTPMKTVKTEDTALIWLAKKNYDLPWHETAPESLRRRQAESGTTGRQIRQQYEQSYPRGDC